MRIADIDSTASDTVLIPLIVDGEECFIRVFGIESAEYSRASQWFKQVCAKKSIDGNSPLKVREVMGEKIAVKTDEYKKLECIMYAHIVESWGFDDELTIECAAKLFEKKPSICTEIDEQISLKAYRDSEAKKKQRKQP